MEKQSTMILTEDNFIKTFLSLLHNYGVHEINSEELSKKLFYYYENSVYSEIFQNIKRVAYAEQVEIKSAIERELLWGSGIIKSFKEPSKLLLAYEFDSVDLSRLDLSKLGCELLEKMAKEFALRYKIEKNSKFNMNIYGTTPNRDYLIFNGDRLGNSIKWEMITDGELKKFQNYLKIRIVLVRIFLIFLKQFYYQLKR